MLKSVIMPVSKGFRKEYPSGRASITSLNCLKLKV